MLRALVAATLAALFLSTPPADAVERIPAGETLLYSDFATWDSRWVVRGESNVVWASGGSLALGIDKDANGTIRQARIDADLDFTYGTIRARMRFLGPKGAHAAFWAQSLDVNGTAYCIGCAEIDVAEHFGPARVWQSLYWCPCSPDFQERQGFTDLDPSAWHYYKVDWTPTGYAFYIDGNLTASWSAGLSNKPHLVVLSYLSSDWERANLQTDRLGQYRAYVDFVEVKANAWTEVGP